MYRPVSGLWQVVTYHLFRANALPHHLLNLLLHCGTCLLAGILACNLTGNRKTGWLVSGLILVHPRAALGVSLIFNFTDVLSAFLMMVSMVVLYAIRQEGESWTPLKIRHQGGQLPSGPGGCRRANPTGTSPYTLFNGGLGSMVILWIAVGLALGTKEVYLPMVVVLLSAEVLWKPPARSMSKAVVCHTGILILWITYLLARTHFIGHPFRTHHPELSFPLPPHSKEWTIFWDSLVMVFTLGGTLVIWRSQTLRRQLPQSSDWMLLWSGCMLLPAVHFCSQVTLRPWFFDERYWYVPLVPLSVFAAALLNHGTKLSSVLGAAILAITLPGTIGYFIAGMALVMTLSLLANHPEREVQRTTATLFLTAIALILWQRCAEIRLRADEADGLHVQLKRVITETPPQAPIALLEFTEQKAEPRLSFNGAFQWLLTPPFFAEDISDRFFFAYPTWNSPPTNRFWDRTTSHLLEKLDAGEEVTLYSWDAESRKFRSLGVEKGSTRVQSALPNLQAVPMEPVMTVLDSSSPLGKFKASWQSTGSPFDPKLYRVVVLRLARTKSETGSVPLEIELNWVSQRSPQWSAAKEIRVHGPSSLGSTGTPSKAELWLYPGRRVDWLLGGRITELRVMANQPLALEQVQIASSLPESILSKAEHIDEYTIPEMKFLWENRILVEVCEIGCCQ